LGNNRKWNFYSDGSLTPATEYIDAKMGSGWTTEECDLQFYFGVKNWPSSTRAELMAIWSIVMVLPVNTSAKIYTDSAAAIQGIQSAREIIHDIHRLKFSNRSIVNSITT
jgi:RNase H.